MKVLNIYTGPGLYSGLKLCTSPEAYIAGDGVYAYTSDLSDGIAFIKTQVEIKNEARENLISDKI